MRTPDTSFGGIYAKKQVRIAGDNVTKVIGQHTFRAGVFYQWDSNPQASPFVNTNGTVNLYYIGETITDPVKGLLHSTGPVGSGNGGNYLADFAEGYIFQYNQTNLLPAPNLYFWNLAGYVQDHWRATNRLTVDIGVRLEHITPWQDSHNQGLAVFTTSGLCGWHEQHTPWVAVACHQQRDPELGTSDTLGVCKSAWRIWRMTSMDLATRLCVEVPAFTVRTTRTTMPQTRTRRCWASAPIR